LTNKLLERTSFKMNRYRFQISQSWTEGGSWERHELACRALTKKRIYIIYAILTVCSFVILVDAQMEKPILPNVLSYFDALSENGNISMLTYLVGGLAQPFWGKLSDLIGRRWGITTSLSLYILGNVLNCAAWDYNSYAAGIGISAFGGAGITTLVQIMIGDIFPARVRGAWQSYFEIAKIITAWAGPYIGDAILNVEWRAMYGILIALGVICLIPAVIWIKLPAPFQMGKSKSLLVSAAVFMDLGGLIILSAGSGCLLVAIKYGGNKWAWDSAESITFFVLGPLLLLALVPYEKYIAAPGCKIMSSDIILNRNAIGACLITITLNLAVEAYYSYRNLYLQVVSDYDPSTAGVLTGFYSTFATISSIGVGWLVQFTGHWRLWTWMGVWINYVGVGMSIGLDRDTEFWYNALLNSINGFGGGMITCPILVAAQDAVKIENLATMTAVYGFFKYFGSALGAQIASATWTGVLDGKISDATWTTPSIDLEAMKKDINYITCKNDTSPCLEQEDWDQLKGMYEDTFRILAYYSVGLYVLVLASMFMLKKQDLSRNEQEYTGWKKDGEEIAVDGLPMKSSSSDSYEYEYEYELSEVNLAKEEEVVNR